MSPTVTHAALLDTIRRESSRLAEVAASTPPGTPVPGCPDWTVQDLQTHVSVAMRFWQTNVEHPESTKDEARRNLRQALQETADRFLTNREALLAVLTSREPSDAAYASSWTAGKNVSFVTRFLAHEISIHRVDAELAAGDLHPLEPEIASDGVDEFLDLFAVRRRPKDMPPFLGSVHLRCTDVAGEWIVQPAESGGPLAVTREQGRADVAARGTANDLLLMLWRRLDASALNIVGDRNVLDRFLARLEV